MYIWIIDPVTKLPSVSLTLLSVSFIGVIVSGALNIAGVVSTTSLFTEIFYSCCALYFGRRFSLNGKSFSSDKAEEIKQIISKE